ncbi:phage tail protein [Actinotalea subterranea]|uniref:phage tail protein n=1 Tax=Actinotalea subterranea TaxID=2607497 RepID=UPI0011EDD44E|nr:tail fiber protein [Actinotalea subterranea]
MGQPYVGEIRMFGGNFAPIGWAMCDGQLLSISENDVLFTLIGTTYGGDGQQTFAVPDLRGRWPLHQDGGHVLGRQGGLETVLLTTQQLPVHRHTPQGSAAEATASTPAGGVWAASTAPAFLPTPGASTAPMATGALDPVGGSEPHENRPPYLVVHFIISLYGIYPAQA